MKRLFLLILLLCYSITVGICQKVASKKATEIAIAVYKRSNLVKDVQVKSLIPIVFKSDTMYYIATFAEKGFTIISGYDFAPPILGECYTDNFDFNNLPSGLEYLIDKYKNEISSLKERKAKATKEVKNQWDNVLLPQNKSYTVGSHLVPTTWNQTGTYAYYSTPDHPIGCTGVAMAQILYYWQCRVLSFLHSYMWIDMHTNQGDLANALLINDCSLAASTSSSGASTPGQAKDGLVNYFGISSSCNVQWRIWHLSTWYADLTSEIDLGQPFIYNAGSADFVGHSWVIDGYNSNGSFYCNWGWGGTYNGFYSLGGFNPDGNDNFDQFESAIFTIVPNQPTGVATPQLTQQTFTYNPNGYQLTVPTVYGASSYEWITNHGTISGNTNTVRLYSDCPANIVQVRAYNYQCGIYSPYSTAVISLNYGPVVGNQLLCTTGAYTVTNVPGGATITWNYSSNMTQVSPPNSNPCTFQKSSNGNGSISTTITLSCGTSSTYALNVHTGPYSSSDYPITGPSSAQCKSYVYYSIPSLLGTTAINWQWPSGWTYVSGQNTNSLAMRTGNSSSSGMVLVGVSNNCGSSGSYATKYTSVYGSCTQSLIVSPNPASTIISVNIDEDFSDNSDSLSISKLNKLENRTKTYFVKILDKMGTECYSTKQYSNSFSISVSNLKNGNYILTASDGTVNMTSPFIIIH